MSQIVVHKLVAETAKGIAGAAYEDLALDDWFYRHNRSPHAWINDNWGRFIVAARQSLAGMLEGPYDEQTKHQIYEALIADTELPNLNLRNQIKLN